jgi:hypothetical protein
MKKVPNWRNTKPVGNQGESEVGSMEGWERTGEDGRSTCQSEKPPFLRLTGWLKREGANCGLHPLIHTLLEFALAQDFGGWQDRLLRDSDATMIMQP